MIDIDALFTTIFILLPILAALGCLYYTFYFLKVARSVEDNPTSKIRSAAQGYIELSGTTKPLLNDAPLLGKLTQKPCAWYRYTIEELVSNRTSDASHFTWQLLEHRESFEPFLLEDGTGECVILPAGANVLSPYAISWRGHTRKTSLPYTSFFSWLWNSWGRYRYTEYRLELNTSLFTQGMFITLNVTDPRIVDNSTLHRYITEKKVSTFNILFKEGLSSQEHFILSTVPETRLIRQFRFQALIFFVAFLFFAALSFNSTYPIIKKTLLEWPLKAKGVFS